jgi:hypothetical protein
MLQLKPLRFQAWHEKETDVEDKLPPQLWNTHYSNDFCLAPTSQGDIDRENNRSSYRQMEGQIVPSARWHPNLYIVASLTHAAQKRLLRLETRMRASQGESFFRRWLECGFALE